MSRIPGKRGFNLFAIAAILLLSLVFLPGLHGPFVFDDLTNITNNDYLKINSLEWSSLLAAANSGIAGPLGRPLPMVTFALDHFIAGSFNNTLPFKLTNLVIHIVNVLLVYVLLYRLGARGIVSNSTPSRPESIKITALVGALAWMLHPIQVNTVHYTVQRMTSLSALFVLLALLAYLYTRERIEQGRNLRGTLLTGFAALFFILLGMLSKENAILALPLAAILEYFYFRNSPFWEQAGQARWFYLRIPVVVAVILLATWFIYFSLPGYANRDFTMIERLLTESRVLVFYLYLIIVPVVSHFGLFHDGFGISVGLLQPYTTLLSLLFIISLVAAGVRLRKRYPYLLFAICWFLVAHSIESTFLALEPVHEHRNYIALVGPVIVLAAGLSRLDDTLGRRWSLIASAVIIAALAIPTHLRSSDWGSKESLLFAESYYHPASPRAHAGLSSVLVARGDLQNGLSSMRKAQHLAPTELGYALNVALILSWSGEQVPQQLARQILQVAATERLTPLSNDVLQFTVNCSLSSCRQIYPLLMQILDICANRTDLSKRRRAQYHYYTGSIMLKQGRYEEAIKRLTIAHQNDRHLVLALLGIGEAYLATGNLRGFTELQPTLIATNKRTRFPRDKEVKMLISRYNEAMSKVSNKKP